MGSVKDLKVITPATEEKPGIAEFIFSDRYSVFDWGEMPDHIPLKGTSIAIATAYFFEKIEKNITRTHYIGLVENGKVKRLNELDRPSNIMRFKLLRVMKPALRENGKYDYSVYAELRKKGEGNFLIPLEIIYRNSLPEGSSVFKRLKNGSLKLEDIGLKEPPEPGQKLEKPILDVSTKIEETDRYLPWDEAQGIAGLSHGELQEIKEITLKIDKLITEEVARLGLSNEDGKVEFGFDEKRNILLVDAVGTLDECRFTYRLNGKPVHVSKEIARIFYRNTNWYREVEKAKKEDRINWKKLVKVQPPKLPEELLQAISWIYQAYANELTGKRWFDAPPLREALSIAAKYI